MQIIIDMAACAGCCADNSCTLSCQYKEGTAELCGYDEFGTPSVPPAKYRKLQIGAGTAVFTVCGPYETSDCELDTCPANYGDSASVTVPGCGTPLIMSGSLVQGSPAGPGAWDYTASCTAHTDETPPVPQGCQVWVVSDNCVTVVFNSGDTKTLSTSCVNSRAVLHSGYCGGAFSTAMCIDPGGLNTVGNEDHWNYTGQYSATDCSLVETDDSYRQGLVNCIVFSGSPTSITCGTPADCYADGATITDGSPTQESVDGDGCVTLSGNYYNFDGTVISILSEEDTDGDAYARALAGIADWTPADNCNISAFEADRGAGEYSFEFIAVQVAATLTGLIVGHDYEVTIGLFRRIIGGSTWDHYVDITTTVTAESTSETTDWFDVSNDVGYETQAQTCAKTDLG